MSSVPQIKVPATYMRGGTSKGVFLSWMIYPPSGTGGRKARDQLLLRVIGSPDPWQNKLMAWVAQLASTSKTVILAKKFTTRTRCRLFIWTGFH